MIWGVKNFLKKILALFLALFGEKVAHLNSKHLRTLKTAAMPFDNDKLPKSKETPTAKSPKSHRFQLEINKARLSYESMLKIVPVS